MKMLSVNGLIWPAVVLSVALWGAAAYIWSASYQAPIVYLGGDKVEPKVVKRGDEVTVTRNMRFLREDEVKLSRAMIRGDCRKNCEIVDLPSSHIAITPSENISRSREIVIPVTITPGVWRLVFSMHWGGMFGRTMTVHLPELEVEVIQ